MMMMMMVRLAMTNSHMPRESFNTYIKTKATGNSIRRTEFGTLSVTSARSNTHKKPVHKSNETKYASINAGKIKVMRVTTLQNHTAKPSHACPTEPIHSFVDHRTKTLILIGYRYNASE